MTRPKFDHTRWWFHVFFFQTIPLPWAQMTKKYMVIFYQTDAQNRFKKNLIHIYSYSQTHKYIHTHTYFPINLESAKKWRCTEYSQCEYKIFLYVYVDHSGEGSTWSMAICSTAISDNPVGHLKVFVGLSTQGSGSIFLGRVNLFSSHSSSSKRRNSFSLFAAILKRNQDQWRENDKDDNWNEPKYT